MKVRSKKTKKLCEPLCTLCLCAEKFFQHRVHRGSQSYTEKIIIQNHINQINHSSDKVFGLLRSARNDAVPFCEPCVSFANLAVKKLKPQRTQRFSQRTQRKNLVNLENLNKILVQTITLNIKS